jgi:hypothetical protein
VFWNCQRKMTLPYKTKNCVPLDLLWTASVYISWRTSPAELRLNPRVQMSYMRYVFMCFMLFAASCCRTSPSLHGLWLY